MSIKMLTFAECSQFRRLTVEFSRLIDLSTTSINDSMVMSFSLLLAAGNSITDRQRKHAEQCFIRALAADTSPAGLASRCSGDFPLYFDEHGVYISASICSNFPCDGCSFCADLPDVPDDQFSGL